MYIQIWWHSLQLQHLRRWDRETTSIGSSGLLGETLFKQTEGRKGRKKHNLTEWWSIISYEVGQETYMHFLKTNIESSNRHGKRWLTSLVIAKIQIKKTTEHLFSSRCFLRCGIGAVWLQTMCHWQECAFQFRSQIEVRVRLLLCGKMLF